MKLLTTMLGMFISLPIFGQDNAPETHKLLIGVTVSPDICFRTLKNTDGSSTSDLIIGLRNDREHPKLSYSSGFSLCYNPARHWAIETGLLYANTGFTSVTSNPTFGDPIDPQYGFVYVSGDPITKITLIHNFHYLNIPLRTIFTIGNRKVRFISSVGITTNILIDATTTSVTEYANNDTDRNTQEEQFNYTKINLTPTVSIGIDWQLSNKFNIRIEPAFGYGLLKIIDAPITAYLWGGGLHLTCYYALK